MEQIASIKKLQGCLEPLPNSSEEIQNLITELHFAYQNFKFGKEPPVVEAREVLWNAAYYLLTAYTNPVRRLRLEASVIEDGLAISGLVFELLGLYAEIQEDSRIQRECFLNASIANTLSKYEANSAVLAKKYFQKNLVFQDKQSFLLQSADQGANFVLALLGREHFWIYQSSNNFTKIFSEQDTNPENAEYPLESIFWISICLGVIQYTNYMIGGDDNHHRTAETLFRRAREVALNYELISEHWLASRLLDCIERMTQRSTWRILRIQGFSENYISTLTRFPWHAVHELWESQIQALFAMENPSNPRLTNFLSNEVKQAIISMPTSAGKTLLAELAIVRTLEHKRTAKCVYVAPARALVDEVEAKLHRRLRFLGFRVSNVTGSFEISPFEQDYLKSIDVAVLTPEKLDYLFRKRDPFTDDIELIVFDEMHKVREGSRGWLFETLVTWLLLKPKLQHAKLIFMSAVLPTSQQPRVRTWIGKEVLAPIVASNWSPTRQLIGILWYPQNWSFSYTDEAGNRYYESDANLSFRYSIGNEQTRTINGIYRPVAVQEIYKRGKKKGSYKKREDETRFDRCIELIKRFSSDTKILVYFQEKQQLLHFCDRAEKLEPIENPKLRRLIEYIAARLGANFPMTKSLLYGVAFHHGDLPIDVRSEIENAYREKIIRILACTTTLAEGVNLPTQVLILGYPQTYNKNRLSVSDFKNIIGRAGRALVETEGQVIAIRHPEFRYDAQNAEYFDSLINIEEDKLSIQSAFLKSEAEEEVVLAELNKLAQTIEDTKELANLEYEESLADLVQRLQIFIFTLYEEQIIASDIGSISNALNHTLLFVQNGNNRIQQAVLNLSYRYTTFCSQIEPERLRRINTSGLRYQSNVVLEQLTQELFTRCMTLSPEDYAFERIITATELNFILDHIPEAKIQRKEYRNEQYVVVQAIDHYAILLDWLNGEDFADIRDKHFSSIKDIAIRTETFQSYVSKQFTYKLPWVFASLHTHTEHFGNPTLNLWLEAAPAQVKYGVNTPEAVYFSSIGIRSRFLAIRLGELYRSEQGVMTEGNWQPLETWFYNLTPFYLQDTQTIPDLAIRQAIQRINLIRSPNTVLRRNKRLRFSMAGWQYYIGERIVNNLLEQLQAGNEIVVYFQHEVDNDYDEYAVSIHLASLPAGENKLGYVPRVYNEEVATLIALGRTLEAKVINIGQEVERNRWRRVEVQVRLIAEGVTEDELSW